MHWSRLPLTDQIFTHIDSDTGEETTFAASMIRRYCDTGLRTGVERVMAVLTQEGFQMVMTVRGIEPPRLRRAMRTKHYEPLLWAKMPDQTCLLIDGSHTYAAMWSKGVREARSYLVAEATWRQFTVEGLPPVDSVDSLIKSYSGIKA